MKKPKVKPLNKYTEKELFDLINFMESEIIEYKNAIKVVKKELLKR